MIYTQIYTLIKSSIWYFYIIIMNISPRTTFYHAPTYIEDIIVLYIVIHMLIYTLTKSSICYFYIIIMNIFPRATFYHARTYIENIIVLYIVIHMLIYTLIKSSIQYIYISSISSLYILFCYLEQINNLEYRHTGTLTLINIHLCTRCQKIFYHGLFLRRFYTFEIDLDTIFSVKLFFYCIM